MPTGEIELRQVDRLKEMGQWLRQYGQSIYGTRGGPFKPGSWGASTSKGNSIFLHLLDNNQEALTLPAIEKRIVRSSVLTGGTADVNQTPAGVTITIPRRNADVIGTLILLELDGSASEITPRSLSSGALPHQAVRASNVFQKQSHYGPEKAMDEDSASRWATDAGTRQAWLEVDLGNAQTFDRVAIEEAFPSRVQNFELQYQEGNEWRTIFAGKKVGAHFSKTFKPVTSRLVRLQILDATEGPTIFEFQLFKPAVK
jgi:alpha-L-fucosidase